jgi:hypothetical protein
MSSLDDGYGDTSSFTRRDQVLCLALIAVFLPLVIILWIGILTQ